MHTSENNNRRSQRDRESACWKREETVERVKASVAIRAKLGSPLGGPAPYGYEWRGKKLIPNPKEAPVRKLMYDLFLQHGRKKTVVRLLNKAGHRTRKGALFTSKTLTRLLQDPTAKGVHRANYTSRNGHTKQWFVKPESEWVLNTVEPIVAPEVWEQCNQLIDASYSHQKRPSKKPVNTFAAITYCACGEKMHVPSNSPKYVCRKCHNKIPIADLEAVWLEEIKAYSYSPKEIAAYLEKANSTVLEKQELLAVQEAESRKTQKEIDRLYRHYQQEQLDPASFNRFYKPLEERQKQLNSDIPRLQAEIDVCKVNNLSAEEIASEARDLSERWPGFTPEDKRRIVETIVDRIIIGKDEISINLCYLPPCKELAPGWRKGRDSNPR